jgi:hypothetical protein
MTLPIKAIFICSVCSKQAGSVILSETDNGYEVTRESFTSKMTSRVSPSAMPAVMCAIEQECASDLFHCDFEYAPFYCPKCDASYCGDHWVRHDVFDNDDGFVWHDSIRGRCPKGHERMLED